MHPSDRPLYQRRLIEHLKGETPRFSCDVRYLTEDGTWRWARQHGIAFRGPDGRAKRLIGAAGDITEIKQREFELQAARAAAQRVLPSSALDDSDLASRYALALESISVGAGAYDINLDTGMVYLAPALVEVLNLPEYGPVSAFADVVHPDDRPHHTRMIAALYKGEIPRLDIEFRYRGRDGTWRWARQHGIVVRGPDGAARRMVGVTGDITETRQRERQLQMAKAEAAAAQRDVEQTREVMQTVLDNMTDGVTLFDKDFRWQFSNRAPHRGPRIPAGLSHARRARARAGALSDPSAATSARSRMPRRCSTRPSSASSSRAATATNARTSNGRFTEFTYKPLENGAPARHLSRHHRTEGARERARRRQGSGRSRARRRRARARRGERGAQRGRTDTRPSCRPCSTT